MPKDQTVEEVVEAIDELYTAFKDDADKFIAKGTAAAAKRCRKYLQAMKPLMVQFRKMSLGKDVE